MACKDFGLDAGALSFVLTHKRATVDLSQPFRFTGIPQNATLELAVSDVGAPFPSACYQKASLFLMIL